MQSTKSNQAFPSIYSNPVLPQASVTASVPAKASSPGLGGVKGLERSFVIACGLGAVTVIFGVTALIYQFAPEFNKLRNASGQGEMPKFSTVQG